jgi:hypothetical protein
MTTILFPARHPKDYMRPIPGLKVKGRQVYEVVIPFSFWVDGIEYHVKPGWRTDGASIPWYGRLFFQPWGKNSWAAVLHDYLLGNAPELSKAKIDKLFYKALLKRTNAIHAGIMYLAVRMKTRRD